MEPREGEGEGVEWKDHMMGDVAESRRAGDGVEVAASTHRMEVHRHGGRGRHGGGKGHDTGQTKGGMTGGGGKFM